MLIYIYIYKYYVFNININIYNKHICYLFVLVEPRLRRSDGGTGRQTDKRDHGDSTAVGSEAPNAVGSWTIDRGGSTAVGSERSTDSAMECPQRGVRACFAEC